MNSRRGTWRASRGICRGGDGRKPRAVKYSAELPKGTERGRREDGDVKLSEYASYDALGLADLVTRKEVSPKELAQTAARAIEAVNPAVNAVVETYADRIANPDERTLGSG